MRLRGFELARKRSRQLAGIGLGLRFEFLEEFLEDGGDFCRFVEVSPENYMKRGGFYRAALDEVAKRLPVVSHGLTLSLGAADDPDPEYLAELRRELRRVGALWHSDHICFSSVGRDHLHELLPLPCTVENAVRVARRLSEVESSLGIPMCAEHVTWYAEWGAPQLEEAAFLAEILERGNCGLLLDVNNVFVNAHNHGFDAMDFVRALPLHRVVELHVAGHCRGEDGLLLDTHGAAVCADVLELLKEVVQLTGPVPVLLERDTNVPELAELRAEVSVLDGVYRRGLARTRCAPRPCACEARGPGAREVLVRGTLAEPNVAPNPGAPAQRGLEGLVRQWIESAGADELPLGRAAGNSALPASEVSWLQAQNHRGLLLYRRLMVGRVERALAAMMPLTARSVGEPFRKACREFARMGPRRSRFSRDLALPFLEMCVTHPQWLEGWPLWAHDMARHETAVVLVAAAEDDTSLEGTLPTSEQTLPLRRCTRLMHYTYPVHRLWEDPEAGWSDEQGAWLLLLYRDESHIVRSLELSPLAYAIVSHLARRLPLNEAVMQSCVQVSQVLDRRTREEVATLLDDFWSRGLFLAGEPPS